MPGKKSSPFQLAILIGFGLFLAIGVLLFARFAGFGGEANTIGTVVIWGELNEEAFARAIVKVAEEDGRFRGVTYVQKDSDTFGAGLANALASGEGPDAYLLVQDKIVQDRPKIFPIPYEQLSRRQFMDTFVEEGELFLDEEGVLGLPVAVDPMVLFWNRDIMSGSGYSAPPARWGDLSEMTAGLTTKDAANTVLRSAISFGEYDNVPHAKEILSALILQAGGNIVEKDAEGKYVQKISESVVRNLSAAEISLTYYTNFSNPARASTYTWNRSLRPAREAFAAGDAALYIGFASELPLIQDLNPNLNFDISLLPQANIEEGARQATYARMYAFAYPKNGKNVSGAIEATFLLVNADRAEILPEAWNLPSARRDVLSSPKDGAAEIFRRSAIIARGWFDPSPAATERIFERMIESVTAGSASPKEAVNRADQELGNIISGS